MGHLFDRGHKQFLKFINNLNLKDVFQLKHGNKVKYMFERGDIYKSRIDYIFINGQIDFWNTSFYKRTKLLEIKYKTFA